MKNNLPISALVAIGLAAAALWRIEVEAHGWYGLIWISYFHWAIPAGVIMFAAWLSVFSAVHPTAKRIAFSIAFIVFAAAAYLLAHKLAVWHEYPPFIWELERPIWTWVGYLAIFPYIPLVYILFLLLAKSFGASVPRRGVALGACLWLIAFPLSMALLALVKHKGDSDMLHAIKSGFVVPFLIVSLGLPLLTKIKKGDGQQSPSPYSSPAAGSESGEA